MSLENRPQTDQRKRLPDRKADIKSHFSNTWLSDKDVAALADISRNRVWAWVRIGNLPRPTKLGPNTSRWHMDDIRRWEEERREEAA